MYSVHSCKKLGSRHKPKNKGKTRKANEGKETNRTRKENEKARKCKTGQLGQRHHVQVRTFV